jgi:hypothetical protein
MPFDINAPFTVQMSPVDGGSAVQQGTEFYCVRVTPAYEAGPAHVDALGPYASAAEALSHAGELPPLPPQPPIETPAGET